MTSSIVSRIDTAKASPFDSIRQFDEQGNEFWTGRDLMKMMGYTRWDSFETPITQAIENLEINGDNVYDHFCDLTRKSRGRNGKDYKMSRYACYMTALCCDGRKPEVASAKKYFAVKTREAETVIPAQNERLRELELRLKIAELEKATSDNHLYLEGRREFIMNAYGVGTLALIQGRPDAIVHVKETVTETVICRDGRNVSFEGKSTAEIGKELQFKTGKEFERWLTSKGRQDLICQGMRAVQAPYIPTEHLAEVKKLWSESRKDKGTQLLLGE